MRLSGDLVMLIHQNHSNNMELFLRLFAVFQNLLCLVLDPICWVWSKVQINIPMQPIKKPLLKISATQLAAQIRNGEVGCEDAVLMYAFRRRRVDIRLHCSLELRSDEAVKSDACKVDQLIASKTKSVEELEKTWPLLGVPFTVQLSCKVQGMNCGKGDEALSDSPAVSLLRKAGAIPVAVTSQSAPSLHAETYHSANGLTRNPYDVCRTVGGCAGGEAALNASAGTVFGIGSELLGSIRGPAMFTGVFSHRPTLGVLATSEEGVGVEEEVVGPVARFAEDLPLLTRIIAGDQAHKLRLDKPVDLKKTKIFYMTSVKSSIGLRKVDKEIKQAILKAVNHLKNNFQCETEEASFQEMSDCPEICRAVLFNARNFPDALNIPEHKEVTRHSNSIVDDLFTSFPGLTLFSLTSLNFYLMKVVNRLIPFKKLHHYLRKNEDLKKKIIDTLGEDGVLFLPTHPTAAFYHYQSLIRALDSTYSMIVTSLGLPATQVPMGLNRNGLPIGFQVVAAPYQDRLCLAVAKELEKAFGGWVHPPSLPTLT